MDTRILSKWIEESLESENLTDFRMDLADNSKKTDGYLGEIVFVTVNCKDKTSDDAKVISLVIKHSQNKMRDVLPLKMLFMQEVTIYTKIFPALLRFQLDRSISAPFTNYPKCYNTKIFDDFEAIIFENLKSTGYDLHDRKVPLNQDQTKIILEAYAKFHATSIVLNNQKSDDFKKICQDLTKFVSMRFQMPDGFPDVLNTFFKTLLKQLKERNKIDLYGKFENFLKRDWNKEILDMIEEKTGLAVISHLDAWNNNYLFKYDAAKSKPTDVKIIDWQMADVMNSPVFDISHFLYSCASLQDLANLEHLLKHYHDHLTRHISNLGGDAFPFSTLKEHWEKFKLFGFVHVVYVMKQCYWNDEDVENEMDPQNWAESTNRIVIKDEVYYERLFGILKHFFEYKL